MPLREVHLGASALPQHEVGDAQFARCAHHHIDSRKLGQIEIAIDRGLIDSAARGGGLRGVHHLSVTAVIEGDCQNHAGVARRVGDCLANRALHVARRPRFATLERSPHPLDADVQLVELGDAPEQLLV